MNDRTPPPVSDEDVSAVLDGEADDALAERVRREAPDRLQAVEAARRLVAEARVEPLAPSVVDDLVAAALAGAQTDGDDAGADADEAGDAAHELAADHDDGGVVAIPAPRRPARRLPAALVAAAVIALLVVGLGLIRRGLDSSDEDTAARFDKVGSSITADEAGGKAAGAEASSASDLAADASTTTVALPGLTEPATAASPPDPVTVTYLGTFPDADALRRALAQGPPAAAERGVARAAVDRCQQQVATVLSLEDPPLSVGQAVVGGRSVLVYTYAYSVADDPTVTRLVSAVGQDACDPVLTFQR